MIKLKVGYDVAVMACAAVLGVMPTASAAETVPSNFCERLAPKLNMKMTAESPNPREDGREWKVSLMSLGLALFGGTINASFGVRPIGDWTTADVTRLHDVCQQTHKGVTCNVVGPMRLTVGTKTGNVDNDALVGERATVGLRKSAIYCRNH